ncbi:phospholipase D/nuclease [Trematosphaeria pertusa]|uniref:Phospholipase D/nuclease n=1 Tax=Trematosphaeria pertusa TaxID=390896 RepID=A0A6A6IH60_9PLEO|nr:phospholipase D/nuclease [Trematosphaeria pertusa]KAF2249497.1 phospholipase D/nuclease [Trematosphaeria pertusa]
MPASTHPPFQSHITRPFVSTLDAASHANRQDDPNYYAEDPRSLISTSTIHSLITGTGDAVYRSLAPLLESTNHELILVTCFWARSSSLETLNSILRKLSDKAIRRGSEKIQVQLCFSSLSLFQKLFHKQSVTGQTYPPSVWVKKLGLPDPSELGGLELQVKSIFLLPFCVMHPKFMVIDRQTVILPSCNISWEEWFEGCITLAGPIVDKFLRFYKTFWARGKTHGLQGASIGEGMTWQADNVGKSDLGHGSIVNYFSSAAKQSEISDIPTVFLPSPHRRNPRFQPFASTERVVAPPTPLNAFVLTLFAKADKTIRIQTPILTAPPVLSSLLKALERGIDVTILTSERLMVLEQLVTAGTTTSRCIRKLIKRYKKLTLRNSRVSSDEEAVISAPQPGRLRVSYFEPINGPRPRGEEEGEPQQSHLKMTIVDDEVLVLGSGNLDRASWFTSQELGVAFFDRQLVKGVENVVDEATNGRSKLVYDSGDAEG